MNFHQPTEIYFNQAADLRLRQQVSRPRMLLDRRIWPGVRNTLLLVCSTLIAANLWLCHLLAHLEEALQTEENVRHELMETHISLQATRDRLYSADHIQLLASQQLSLYLPDREQVQVYR